MEAGLYGRRANEEGRIVEGGHVSRRVLGGDEALRVGIGVEGKRSLRSACVPDLTGFCRYD